MPWCFINIIKLDLIYNYNSYLVMMTIISLATLLVNSLLGGTSHLTSQDLWKNYKHFTFAKNQRNVTYSSMFSQATGWGSTTTVITRPSLLCIPKTDFKSLYPKSNKTSFSFNFDSVGQDLAILLIWGADNHHCCCLWNRDWCTPTNFCFHGALLRHGSQWALCFSGLFPRATQGDCVP